MDKEIVSIENNILDFIKIYPQFIVVNENEGFLLSGLYHLFKEHNGIYIEDFFYLKIFVSAPPNYGLIPIVYEDGRIGDFQHKYLDNSLCLGIPLEILAFLKKTRFNLVLFFERYIIPYLYNAIYFEIYRNMPFGEWAHGINGYLEFFKEIFKIKSDENTKSFINYLLAHKYYKGHNLCPCNSGLKIRECHKEVLFKYFNEHQDDLMIEIRNYIAEVNKDVKSKDKR